MGATLFLIIGLCALLGFAIFNGFVAGTGKTFSDDPSSSAYQGKELREEASQKAEDIAVRNQRLMENTRSRMDRNR